MATRKVQTPGVTEKPIEPTIENQESTIEEKPIEPTTEQLLAEIELLKKQINEQINDKPTPVLHPINHTVEAPKRTRIVLTKQGWAREEY